MGKFNLAEVLGAQVSELDTAPVIEMIDIDRIDSNEKNFYELSDLDGLAESIALEGVQQPLIVTLSQENAGQYLLISGHRRLAAVRMLVYDETHPRDDLLKVPCICKQYASPQLAELALIYGNAATRKLTSAELGKQAERIEMLLYELKEQGVEFPGKMRDHVADACNVSASKLARLKVIREKLIPEYAELFEKNDIGEAVAYALAQQEAALQQRIHSTYDGEIRYFYESTVRKYVEAYQKIWSIKPCKGEAECINRDAMFTKCTAHGYYSYPCDKCCKTCSQTMTCRTVCPKIKDEILEKKRAQRAEAKTEKQAQAERDAEKVAQIQKIWYRFGEARRAAGTDHEEAFKLLGVTYWSDWRAKDMLSKESGEYKITTSTDTPYSRVPEHCIAALAEGFGVTIDYLFCRTDDPRAIAKVERPAGSGWQERRFADKPAEGQLVLMAGLTNGGWLYREAVYRDGVFRRTESAATDLEMAGNYVRWMPLQRP